MILKYQAEIDKRGLSASCPKNVILASEEVTAFRFVREPITDESNYEPNVVEDDRSGYKYPYSANETKKAQQECDRCAISLYNSLDNILTRWTHATEEFKINKGYTHVARGVLMKNDGAMKEPNKTGHFGFYEFEKANVCKKFVEETTLR